MLFGGTFWVGLILQLSSVEHKLPSKCKRELFVGTGMSQKTLYSERLSEDLAAPASASLPQPPDLKDQVCVCVITQGQFPPPLNRPILGSFLIPQLPSPHRQNDGHVTLSSQTCAEGLARY